MLKELDETRATTDRGLLAAVARISTPPTCFVWNLELPSTSCPSGTPPSGGPDRCSGIGTDTQPLHIFFLFLCPVSTEKRGGGERKRDRLFAGPSRESTPGNSRSVAVQRHSPWTAPTPGGWWCPDRRACSASGHSLCAGKKKKHQQQK